MPEQNNMEKKLNDYLVELEKHLQPISVTQRSDILLELSSHIRDSLSDNTKTIDSVLASLGKPEQVASRYLMERGLKPVAPSRSGCLKWGCMTILILILAILLLFVLVIKSCTPVLSVDKEAKSVTILGGLVDVNGKTKTVSLGKGLFKINNADLNIKMDHDDTVTAKEIPVTDFHEINLQCSGDVVFQQAKDFSLTVEGDQTTLSNLRVSVENGVLNLDVSPSNELVFNMNSNDNLVFYVSAPVLNKLDLNGSGDFSSEAITSDQFDIRVHGSADTQISNLQTKNLTVSVQGSGDVKLDGQADNQTIQGSGSGDFLCGGLKSLNATVVLNGSGDARLWVENKLDVTVNGSGDVSYSGNPEISKSINGSGELTKNK